MKFWKKRQDQEENMAGLPESDGEKAQTAWRTDNGFTLDAINRLENKGYASRRQFTKNYVKYKIKDKPCFLKKKKNPRVIPARGKDRSKCDNYLSLRKMAW